MNSARILKGALHCPAKGNLVDQKATWHRTGVSWLNLVRLNSHSARHNVLHKLGINGEGLLIVNLGQETKRIIKSKIEVVEKSLSG